MKTPSSCKDEVQRLSLEISSELDAIAPVLLDDKPMTDREESLSAVAKSKLTLMTMFGSHTVERRLCCERNGNYRDPLDEAVILARSKRLPPELTEMTIELSSRKPFRFAPHVISKLAAVKVSHMTLHNIFSSYGDKKNEEDENKRTALFENRESPRRTERQIASV